MIYLQLCEDEPDDEGKRKREVRSLNHDTDDVYSYEPINVVRSNKPSCSQVLVNHCVSNLRSVQERLLFWDFLSVEE